MLRADDNRRDTVERGNGFSAKTPIEGAARLGYLDALEGKGFRGEYAAQIGQWQRNYEAGRQWVVAVRACGLTPCAWKEGARVPRELLDLLAEVRRMTGSGTRPEDYQSRPDPDDTPMRIVFPVVRGRKIREVVI